jgi:hypothetical protein
MGEADAGTLAKEGSKRRTSVLTTLKPLRAQGSAEAREVPTHNCGGRKRIFRALAAGGPTQRVDDAQDGAGAVPRLCTLSALSALSAVCGIRQVTRSGRQESENE